MECLGCCSKGFEIFTDWVIPEGIVHRRLGPLYANHPVMSRFLATPIALISGIVKIFLFPIICLVGAIALPLVAAARHFLNKGDGKEFLKSFGFCVLGFSASILFLSITSYYTPLLGSSALFLGLLSVSITIHVYKLMQEPVFEETINLIQI